MRQIGDAPGLWKQALRFSLSGLTALGAALWLRGPYLWLLWPAASWLALTWAYLRNRPEILGKRVDGSFHRAALVFLPYLAASEAYFHIKRLVLELEPCWNEVAPGIYIGRRPLLRELPGDVRWIVDLTAELYEPGNLVRHGHYRYLPSLNRWVPDTVDFRRLTRELASVTEPIYVHCGSGLGRSATVVAALLILKGLEDGVDQAERRMRRVRPRVFLHPAQRRLVERRCRGLPATRPEEAKARRPERQPQDWRQTKIQAP